MKKIFFVILSLMIISVINAQNPISGTWTEYTTHYITGNSYVPSGQTLTIQKGVTVIFSGQYSLRVRGTISATGTSTDPITFTASNTTTGWRGIRFINYTSGSTSSFTYCNFEYAKKNDSCAGGLSDCTYPLNIITSGGAIYLYNASNNVSFSNCEFTNNEVCAHGGAIFCSYSSPDITYSTFSYNYAGYKGGAISCRLYGSPTVDYCTIDHNSSDRSGGGIWISRYSDPTIDHNTITLNNSGYIAYCEGGGIGICYESSPDITYNTITYNDIVDGSASSFGKGGGIYVKDATPVIDNNTISYNYAESGGGGIYCFGEEDNGEITNNQITNNTSDTKGGGLCLGGGYKPTFEDNNISGNTAETKGGGMYLTGANPLCSDNNFEDNSANYGGAIYLYWANPTFRNDGDYTKMITENSATYDGGGVYLDHSHATFREISFYMNVAQNGGAAYCEESAANFIIISDPYYIKNNEASNKGGGIYFENCLYHDTTGYTPTVGRSELWENTSDDDGGGIYVEEGQLNVLSSLIVGNTADGDGGGIYLYEVTDETYINNATICDNEATDEGGGVATSSTTDLSFTNTIIYFNSGTTNYEEVCSTLGNNGGSSYYNYCGISTITNPGTNIASDPDFSTGGNGYHLKYNSSTYVNAGNNSVSPPISNDLQGNSRILGGTIDIGAYENDGTTYLIWFSDVEKPDIKDFTISFYPNPAKNYINIDLKQREGKYIIEMYDMLGKSVLKKDLLNNQNNPIDLNGMQNGTYLIKIVNENNIIVKTKILLIK